MELGGLWTTGSETAWTAKIYVRHEKDVSTIRESLLQQGAGELWQRSTVLLADICRADLAVEMEVTIS